MKLTYVLFGINLYLILSAGLFAYDSTDEFFAQDLRAHFQSENSLNQVKDLLLVIDMQERFPASRKDWLQSNVLQTIQKAMDEKRLIVFIGYGSMGPTLQALLSRVQGYPLYVNLIKHFDTAYTPLKAMFEVLGINSVHEIQVCGVNTEACVLSTVLDLCDHKMAPHITLLEPCCNSDESFHHERVIKELKSLSNSIPALEVRLTI